MRFSEDLQGFEGSSLGGRAKQAEGSAVSARWGFGHARMPATAEQKLQSHNLPFRVRVVRNEDQLSRAVVVRARAYGRHFPVLEEAFLEPEPEDRHPNSIIFLAEDKVDGAAVGTMRVDTNLFADLRISNEIELPTELAKSTLAYVTRLGVIQGKIGSLAKLALFKTLHRLCLAKQISRILVGAHPPTDRDYLRLEFQDVFAPRHLLSISSSYGVPLRFMYFDTEGAERRWHASANPLYSFMFREYHPDIEVFASVNGMWSQPRMRQPQLSELSSVFDALDIPLI